jgi:hypothetical protein
MDNKSTIPKMQNFLFVSFPKFSKHTNRVNRVFNKVGVLKNEISVLSNKLNQNFIFKKKL